LRTPVAACLDVDRLRETLRTVLEEVELMEQNGSIVFDQDVYLNALRVLTDHYSPRPGTQPEQTMRKTKGKGKGGGGGKKGC
jgi:hypothetical protein